ncbi:MAG: sugar ABC transporter permease [Candidatus Hydrogenedentes bacterium]|nr:sugar ABC transporter permease [Candidatus Hydrogenedentota bacterium]
MGFAQGNRGASDRIEGLCERTVESAGVRRGAFPAEALRWRRQGTIPLTFNAEYVPVVAGVLIAIAVAALLLILQPRFLGPVDTALEWVDRILDRITTRSARDLPAAALLLAPAIAILAAFGIFPILYALFMSAYDLGGRGDYIGLANYSEALKSSAFWDCFFVTVYFAFGSIPITLAVSFLIANLLFRIVRARGFFRTVYFLPYVTSAVAAAMIWRFILRPDDVGLANMLLRAVGIDAKGWLLEPRSVLFFLTGNTHLNAVGPSLALCCVILFEIWHSSGFMIVIFLAGLTSIPKELEEAARIDGAGWFQVTRTITIPLLSPTIFFLTIVSVVKAFQAFNSFYALTGNGLGPLDTTQNTTVYIFTSFYVNNRLGYGAAVATLLCLAIVSLTIAQWRLLGRRVHYE